MGCACHHRGDLMQLERTTRTLHMLNFQSFGDEDSWLFVNFHPQAVLDGVKTGSFFTQKLLESTGFPPCRLVVELLEKQITDEILMEQTVDHYRAMGCLIAIDDFGAGQSNFDRIWKFKPDIVKLDRSLVVHAAENMLARRTLVSLVSLLHETGCLVLLEGVETKDHATICLESGVDFVQGFYFARPQRRPDIPDNGAEKFASRSLLTEVKMG